MSWDLGFWKHIFNKFKPEATFTFKPQGGKPAVLEIARKLEHSKSHKTLCCIDRDFSDLHGETPTQDFVIETYGYAFENDICDDLILSSAVDATLPGLTSLQDIRKEISTLREKCEIEFRWAVRADQILSLYFSSLFDRDGKKYKSVCNPNGSTSVASLSKTRAKEKISERRKNISACKAAKCPTIDKDTWRRMLGHLCWWLNFKICRNVMSKRGYKEPLPEDIFAGVCLNFFGINLQDDQWYISTYYSKATSRAFLAAS